MAGIILSSSLLTALPSSASTPTWVVAGDANGALGGCDPAMVGSTANFGSTWATQPAFQPTTLPCSGGGQINDIDHRAGAGWYAVGYRYDANLRKQGVIFQSGDAQTWSLVQATSNSFDTAYLSVTITPYTVNVAANVPTQDRSHPLGSALTNWSVRGPVPGGPLVQVDVNAITSIDRGGPTDGQEGVGVGSWDGDGEPVSCAGLVSWTFDYTAPLVALTHRCVTGRADVLVGVATSGTAPNARVVGVGYTQSGSTNQPIVLAVTHLSSGGFSAGNPQVLPGGGVLRSVAFDPSGVAVAVGTRTVLGAEFGSAYRSTDGGQTWTNVSASLPPNTKGLRDIVYAGSHWLAVGDGGRVLVSGNGTTWTVASTLLSGTGAVRAIAST